MKFKKYLALFLCGLLASSTIGCSPKPTTQVSDLNPYATDTVTLSTQVDLASSIQAKYGEATTSYIETQVLELKRDEAFEVDLGFTLTDNHNTYDMFQFFADPELTVAINRPAPNEYVDNDTKVIIEPRDYGFFRTEYEGGTPDWGNLSTFYLAKYYDEKGNVTEEPQSVTKIKLITELDRPNVQVVADTNGFATFSWEEVPGATEYVIYTTYLSEEGNFDGDDVLMEYSSTTSTTFNEFQHFSFDTSYITGRETNGVTSANIDFAKNEGISTGFVVIAYGANGEKSAMSRLINPTIYSQTLPYARAYAVEKTEGADDPLLSLPYFMPIEMCDGTIVQYPITYDMYSIEEDTGTISSLALTLPEDAPTKVMSIIGRAQGTPFESVYYFGYTPSKETAEDAMNRFLERQAQVVPNVSGVNTQVVIQEVTKEEVVGNSNKETTTNSLKPENSTGSQESLSTEEAILDDTIPLYATNALSEYLAANMVKGIQEIDVSAFPKSNDFNYLLDALRETLYQNPYILGVNGVGYDDIDQVLYVEYKEDRETQVVKQLELLKATKIIVGEIINANMSDVEKERAINDYLCANITYDMAALENGETHNYEYVDEEFNDSFTAYGALINDVCVCKGYAEAFALLAREAGLDTIVVTGMVGNIGHAWNKVNVANEWLVVDATNNDNPIIPNALFNLPVSIANQVIVEDMDYLLDENLANYAGESLNYEYYRVTDNYIDADNLQAYLVGQLDDTSVDTILVRTDFNLLDDDIVDIVGAAFNESTVASIENNAIWYGIIYIQK